VTLNDLEGHLPVAGLFKCNPAIHIQPIWASDIQILQCVWAKISFFTFYQQLRKRCPATAK